MVVLALSIIQFIHKIAITYDFHWLRLKGNSIYLKHNHIEDFNSSSHLAPKCSGMFKKTWLIEHLFLYMQDFHQWLRVDYQWFFVFSQISTWFFEMVVLSTLIGTFMQSIWLPIIEFVRFIFYKFPNQDSNALFIFAL